MRVHSAKDYEAAIEASGILFGSGTAESLMKLSEDDLLSVFNGVPQMNVARTELQNGINIIELLVDKTKIFPSRGEARKMLQGGGVFLNKEKITEPEMSVGSSSLIKDKYILAQKGKKNYFLIIVQ
jgi:tyrosyl-tRNA synthetase